MTRSEFKPPDRIGYFDGQLLAARDLQDDADGERQLRGLHVRASHNTWGVALGFEVTWKDAALIQVGPGIAYDAHGREIVSAHTLNVGLPVRPREKASAWWFDLVIRYREDLERSPGELGCFEGIGLGEEQPVWRWCYAGPATDVTKSPFNVSPEARLGEDVPLARVLVTAKPAFEDALNFTVRREAQGLVRPHIAGGQVQRQLVFDQTQRAFTTTINTTSAGFNQTPFYFARVTIPALLQLAESGGGTSTRFSFLGPFVTIRSPGRTSFRVDIRIGVAPIGITLADTGFSATTNPQAGAQITWCAIEPNGGCQPSLELLSALFLFPPLKFFPIPTLSAGLFPAVRSQ
jgi:hypothetical protein